MIRIALLSLIALAACTAPGATPADRAELSTIKSRNIAPKLSPEDLVTAFQRLCLNAPRDRAAHEAALRAAGYVPTGPGATQVFLVDDKRPDIALTDTTCVARATARTVQAAQAAAFIRQTYPNARDAQAAGLEHAWQTTQGTIATRRAFEDGVNTYWLILIRGSA